MTELLMHNVWFDTCVYHQPGIDLLFKVIDLDNLMFASEMIGAVRGKDPDTGFFFDDTKRYVDAHQPVARRSASKSSKAPRRKVFPQLDRAEVAGHA